MTLQKLLLKLNKNSNTGVECKIFNDILTITIVEWYTFNHWLSVDINLNEEIPIETINKLKPYFGKI